MNKSEGTTPAPKSATPKPSERKRGNQLRHANGTLRTTHTWSAETMPAAAGDPETIALWRDGQYVAHMSRDTAYALVHTVGAQLQILRARDEGRMPALSAVDRGRARGLEVVR